MKILKVIPKLALGCRVKWGLILSVYNLGFRVWGFSRGLGFKSLGLRVWGFKAVLGF